MKFKLEIDLDSDAMQDQHDVASVLRRTADRLNKLTSTRFGPYGLEGKVSDSNGSIVGKWEVVAS